MLEEQQIRTSVLKTFDKAFACVRLAHSAACMPCAHPRQYSLEPSESISHNVHVDQPDLAVRWRRLGSVGTRSCLAPRMTRLCCWTQTRCW